jgi:hypothetical protein
MHIYAFKYHEMRGGETQYAIESLATNLSLRTKKVWKNQQPTQKPPMDSRPEKMMSAREGPRLKALLKTNANMNMTCARHGMVMIAVRAWRTDSHVIVTMLQSLTALR